MIIEKNEKKIQHGALNLLYNITVTKFEVRHLA